MIQVRARHDGLLAVGRVRLTMDSAAFRARPVGSDFDPLGDGRPVVRIQGFRSGRIGIYRFPFVGAFGSIASAASMAR